MGAEILNGCFGKNITVQGLLLPGCPGRELHACDLTVHGGHQVTLELLQINELTISEPLPRDVPPEFQAGGLRTDMQTIIDSDVLIPYPRGFPREFKRRDVSILLNPFGLNRVRAKDTSAGFLNKVNRLVGDSLITYAWELFNRGLLSTGNILGLGIEAGAVNTIANSGMHLSSLALPLMGVVPAKLEHFRKFLRARRLTSDEALEQFYQVFSQEFQGDESFSCEAYLNRFHEVHGERVGYALGETTRLMLATAILTAIPIFKNQPE